MCCNVLQYVAVRCKYVAVSYSVLQCVAVCCSVLHCVAVCCNLTVHPIAYAAATQIASDHVRVAVRCSVV